MKIRNKDVKPYSHMELNSPGKRPPLDWARVMATVEDRDRLMKRLSILEDVKDRFLDVADRAEAILLELKELE
jgi:hypothetical protein